VRFVTRIEAIARRYWKAEESRDVARIVEFFTEDVEWTAPGLAGRGRAEVGRFYAESAQLYPGLEVTIGRVLGGDDEAAIEWHAVFTDHAGNKATASGVNIMRLEGDRFASVTVYMDPAQITAD
jgi:uncharacterized protein (TIGR02246 family)